MSASLAWAQVVNNAVIALVIVSMCGMLTYCVTNHAADPCGQSQFEGSKRDG